MDVAILVKSSFSSLVSTPCSLASVVLTDGGNIDEAHKGRGNYAYAQIIRELMHKNPHFRVLALTATPGSKPEDVQELCDALHISHIEIRDEFSSDLKQYIFQKVCFVASFPLECFVDPRTPHQTGDRTTYREHERRNPGNSFTPCGLDGGITFTRRDGLGV